ncbi:MAG: UDP-N-acetylglucosamine 2-epimerase (non-hydrolyzing) [Nitrososphaera sp.]|jgi:UDP-N-acetylglucosamine 2-epimerase
MQVEQNVNVVTVAGTRPEIIKLSELLSSLGNDDIGHALLYTGQHFSGQMKDVFFRELGVKPDFDLRLDTSDIPTLAAEMTKFFRYARPRFVLVYGDTNSSLAGARAAAEAGCKIVHIEAGLRCFDLQVPEERARIEIDSLSDHLLPPTDLSKLFLQYEGINENVQVCGNLIVDVCKKLSETDAGKTNALQSLPSEYILLTLHRQENVDDPETLVRLLRHLEGIKQYKVVFPVHPRTRSSLSRFGLSLPENIIPIESLGYTEFLHVLRNSRLVLTDSGGVQEEAVVLGKPCITLRHVSERWETLLLKANVLFPPHRRDSLAHVVDRMKDVRITSHPYGNEVARKMHSVIRSLVA